MKWLAGACAAMVVVLLFLTPIVAPGDPATQFRVDAPAAPSGAPSHASASGPTMRHASWAKRRATSAFVSLPSDPIGPGSCPAAAAASERVTSRLWHTSATYSATSS